MRTIDFNLHRLGWRVKYVKTLQGIGDQTMHSNMDACILFVGRILYYIGLLYFFNLWIEPNTKGVYKSYLALCLVKCIQLFNYGILCYYKRIKIVKKFHAVAHCNMWGYSLSFAHPSSCKHVNKSVRISISTINI